MKQFSLKLITATVAVIIAVLSYGLMSFGSSVKTNSNSEEIVWFHVVNNKILQDMVEPAGPNGDCLTSNPVSTICLAGFLESELDASGHAPTEDPAETEHLAYRANP